MPINLFKPKIQTAGNPYGTYKPPTGNPYVIPTTSAMVVTVLVDGDLDFQLLGEENGQYLNMELAVERDVTTLESLRISLLITTLTVELGTAESVLAYIRLHSLERHFKFTLIPPKP